MDTTATTAPMMPEPIAAARARALLDYDPLSGAFTWKESRGRVAKGSTAGAVRRHGYIGIRLDGEMYFAHRLAWLLMTGAWPGGDVDHRDGNPSNNAWCNLRDVTHRQNSQNKKTHTNNRLGLKGVRKFRSKFRAAIVVDGRRIYLGVHDTPELAHAAYQAAAQRYFGEFARA